MGFLDRVNIRIPLTTGLLWQGNHDRTQLQQHAGPREAVPADIHAGHGIPPYDPHLTPKEVTEYRSTVGCLQWAAGSSRPDLAAGVSLLQSGAPKVEHLRGLYEYIQYGRFDSSTGSPGELHRRELRQCGSPEVPALSVHSPHRHVSTDLNVRAVVQLVRLALPSL
eukprot:3729942-Amphidinium_carterae.1